MRRLTRFPFRLVSMDPGGDTGLSLFLIEKDTFWQTDTDVVGYQPENNITPLKTLQEWSKAHTDLPVTFVYENFHVRPGRAQVETSALEIIGAVREWHRVARPYVELVPREPVQGKDPISDEVLQRMGLLKSGGLTRHINDASRHAVSWLTVRGYRPACIAAWGEP